MTRLAVPTNACTVRPTVWSPQRNFIVRPCTVARSVPVSHCCPGYKECLALSDALAFYAQKVQRLKDKIKMGGSEHHVMKMYVMMK